MNVTKRLLSLVTATLLLGLCLCCPAPARAAGEELKMLNIYYWNSQIRVYDANNHPLDENQYTSFSGNGPNYTVVRNSPTRPTDYDFLLTRSGNSFTLTVNNLTKDYINSTVPTIETKGNLTIVFVGECKLDNKDVSGAPSIKCEADAGGTGKLTLKGQNGGVLKCDGGNAGVIFNDAIALYGNMEVTLDNIIIESYGSAITSNDNIDLTIKGMNRLTTNRLTGTVISSRSVLHAIDLTLSGDGTLTCMQYGGEAAIAAEGDLQMTNGTVNVTAMERGRGGTAVQADNDITISGGKLTLKSQNRAGGAIDAQHELLIEDGELIADNSNDENGWGVAAIYGLKITGGILDTRGKSFAVKTNISPFDNNLDTVALAAYAANRGYKATTSNKYGGGNATEKTNEYTASSEYRFVRIEPNVPHSPPPSSSPSPAPSPSPSPTATPAPVPKTGDSAPLTAWLALALAAGATALALWRRARLQKQ